MDTLDLNIFDGMEGFEEFNPMDDSSLASILDDLEEGTLLSLLEDKNLFIDLPCTDVQVDRSSDSVSELFSDGLLGESDGEQLGYGSAVAAVPDVDLLDTKQDSIYTSPAAANLTLPTLEGHKMLASPASPGNSVSGKRPFPNTFQVESFKRVKLEDPQPVAASDESNDSHLLLCVEHDHCYVPWKPSRDSSTKGQWSQDSNTSKVQRSPVGSSSDEEGSLSDTGTVGSAYSNGMCMRYNMYVH